MSKWVEHIKDFAKRNNLTYGCALSDPKCSEEYRVKFPKPDKKGKTTSLEEETIEIIPVKRKKETIEIIPVKRKKETIEIIPVKRKKVKKKLDLSKTEFTPLEEAEIDTEPKTKMVVAKKPPKNSNLELPNIDKKILKPLIIEYLSKFIKVRGKISEAKKEWLQKDPIGLFNQFKDFYTGKDTSIKWTFTNPSLSPNALVEFIEDKLNLNWFGDWKVGDEVLAYGKKLAKITKITPSAITIRFDEVGELTEVRKGSYGNIYYYDYKRTFKGKTRQIKPDELSYIKEVPSNFDYEYSREGSDPNA